MTTPCPVPNLGCEDDPNAEPATRILGVPLRRLASGSELDAEVARLREHVEKVVATRADQVAPALRATMVIAVHIPKPLGEAGRTAVMSQTLRSFGFKAVWLFPRGEKAFRVDV